MYINQLIFAQKVSPKENLKILPVQILRLSQVTLGDTNNTNRNSLNVKIGKSQEWITLCNLRSSTTENCILDITFDPKVELEFMVKGDASIYLTGNYIMQEMEDDEDGEDNGQFGENDDDDYDEEKDDYDDEFNSKKLRNKIREMNDSEEESSEENKKQLKKKDKKELNEKTNDKKRKNEESHENDKNKKNKEKNNDNNNNNDTSNDPMAKIFSKNGISPNDMKTIRVGEHEIFYVDVIEGKGPKKARKGSQLRIRYEGRFASNGLVFDSTGRHNTYTFTVGRKEVIEGLDNGILKMTQGGRRVMYIPAELAYGEEGKN
eukprot:TRINITY_DN2625_c0_g1_i1.p1 TRINITY_DN2625_c0_g1~~TRINITY_DN2625_c0_g1_i1.p1  ORF type:complete len:319 (+),score=111.86 TRINITY_DN2625_c0_g1_i1:19-975(+)